MSLGTKFQVAAVEESVFQTTPASALQLINCNSFALQDERSAQRPSVFTQDRGNFPSKILQRSGVFRISGPMQYKNMLLMAELVLGNDIATAVSETGTDASVASNVVSSIATLDFTNILVGDMVYFSGWGTASNNRWAGPVLATDATSATFPAGQMTDEIAGATVVMKTQRLTDAEVLKSLSAEWEDTDLTNVFRAMTGVRLRRGVQSWRQNEFVQESYEGIGLAPTFPTATIGTGGPTAALTHDFMNAVDGFGAIHQDGAATSAIISSWELAFESVLEPVYGLGTVGPKQIEQGKFRPMLTARVLLDDNSKTLVDDVIAHTTRGYFWDAVDDQGNRTCWHLPAGKPDDGQPNPEGEGLVDFQLQIAGHSPGKDPTSAYNGVFDYQLGMFFAVA